MANCENHASWLCDPPSRSKFVTSVGFGGADPLAGKAALFALLRRRFTPAALRSALRGLVLTAKATTLRTMKFIAFHFAAAFPLA
jgi:hypothetical protein